ncbi:MAG: SDR family oxidoreductase [Acidobacteriaceae bacterium]|nr:SDR family oxidoreductase [Acidobacteriaceae bacterium]MBV9938460.1 SDR family oxidoreductase [Acidobacteriaceae bacterium]
METGLKNRVALVSGSSQGLGRAIALAFAAEGAHLALCARNGQSLDALASEIRRQHKVQVHTGAFDVRDAGAVEAFVGNVHNVLGSVDICVTNAGGPPAKDFLQTTDADWDDAFALNLHSAVVFARAVIPFMQRERWGRIVTISSMAVRQPLPQLVLSNTIRTGILGLIRTLSNEFAKDGITVNNVGPGYTATGRLKDLSSRIASSTGRTEVDVEQAWIDQIPVGRLGKPEDIADAVVWLASERASFITGQTLLVDGGMYKGM